MKRGSGILTHITTLPTDFGIGDIGPSSFWFIDKLQEAGQIYWQMLPITPTDESGCPYSSHSGFGGYDLLISPEMLQKDGLLSDTELDENKYTGQNDRVNFNAVKNLKTRILKLAFKNFKTAEHLSEPYFHFLEQESSWVYDLAVFEVLTHLHGADWSLWPQDFKIYNVDSVRELKSKHKDEIDFHLFVQFIFFHQWSALKFYANQKSISLIGDLPIFLSYHSVDAWKNPLNFKLDDNFKMLVETGAAPDAFSLIGQKWSTPNYNWTKHKRDKFQFWVKRFEHLHHLFDIIRIDHFRGFCHVWESYTTSKTAENGWWAQTPGEELFLELKKQFPNFPIIVEDLGDITPDVVKLKEKLCFPGMKVLQFAFGSGPNNEHLPDFYTDNCVVYTATHDCSTTAGYFKSLPDNYEKKFVEHYLHIFNFDQIHWEMIKVAMKSKAKIALFPLQDLIGLDDSARFNTPGTVSKSNWSWVATKDQLDDSIFTTLKHLTIEGIRYGSN